MSLNLSQMSKRLKIEYFIFNLLVCIAYYFLNRGAYKV